MRVFKQVIPDAPHLQQTEGLWRLNQNKSSHHTPSAVLVSHPRAHLPSFYFFADVLATSSKEN